MLQATYAVEPPAGDALALTDAQGRFEVTGGAALLYDVIVTAEGFMPSVVEDVRVGFTQGRVTLREGYSLAGCVQDLVGAPVSGATAIYRTLIGSGRFEVQAVTDQEGRYHLDHLPFVAGLHGPRSATLEVRAAGYAPQVKPAALAMLPDEPEPGRYRLHLDVFLTRGATASGVVRTEGEGRPLGEAEVILWSREKLVEWDRLSSTPETSSRPFGVRILGQTRTDEDGRYRIGNVPVVRDAIRVGRFGSPGKEFPGGIVGGHPSRFLAAASFAIPGADEQIIGCDFDLPPCASLMGLVLRSDGRPVPGIAVSAGPEDADPTDTGVYVPTLLEERLGCVSSVATGPSGRFLISRLRCPSEGPVRMRVSASRGNIGSRRHFIDLSAGAEGLVAPIIFDGPWHGSVFGKLCRGTVVDEDGTPVAGALVRWLKPGLPGYWAYRGHEAATDEKGHFALYFPMGEDEVVVRVRARGYASWSCAFARGGRGLSLPPIVLERPREIQGRVTTSRGLPVAGARVYALDPAIDLETACSREVLQGEVVAFLALGVSDASGRFCLEDLPRGACCVLASAPTGRSSERSDLHHRPPAGTLVEGVSSEAEPLTIRLPEGSVARRGDLRVMVRSAEGKAMASDGVMAWLEAQVPQRFNTLTGDLHGRETGGGRIDFPDVPAGVHILRVSPGDGQRMITLRVRVSAGSTNTIIVEAGG